MSSKKKVHKSPSIEFEFIILLGATLFLLIIFYLFKIPESIFASSANHVVISEIQIAGSVANDEFVELFNPTENTIDLSSWKLARRTANGIDSSDYLTIDSSVSGTISPHGFYLVAHPEYNGTITPDEFYSATTSGRLAEDNAVLLYDNNHNLIDLVGLGDAQSSESGTIANPSVGGSVRRINNSEDTDNNSLDFTILAVSDPQNSQSTSSPSATATSSSEPTTTPTQTATPSSSPTESATPTATATATSLASPTASSEPTISPTPSSSPTLNPEPVVVLGTVSFPGSRLLCGFNYHLIHIGNISFFAPKLFCVKI